jgi:basic membrane lipoprotein Med (substrate-binding protein (PBP1-ABC) superfamily)
MDGIAKLGGLLLERPRIVVTVAVGSLILVAAAVWIFILADSSDRPPVAAPDVSKNFKVCQLDTQSSAEATTVWRAVQAAAGKAPINAQRLTLPATADEDPIPYFNSLLALHCQLVVTVGTGLSAATQTVAANKPQQNFLNIGTPTNLANVRTIALPLTKPDVITAAVLAAQRTPS